MKIDYLPDMYRDSYYPKHLVDAIKVQLERVEALLATGEKDIAIIQKQLDKVTEEINDIGFKMMDEGSELETVARDDIALTVEAILQAYHIPIDVEEALRMRDF